MKYILLVVFLFFFLGFSHALAHQLEGKGFSETELEEMPEEMKEDILKSGGTKVETHTFEPMHIKKIVGKGKEARKWKGHSTVVFIGLTNKSREYAYHIYNYYKWIDFPSFAFRDILVISWEKPFSPVGNDSIHRIGEYGGSVKGSENETFVYTKWNFDLKGNYKKQGGYAKQYLRIPKDQKGKRRNIGAGYYHSLTPLGTQVTVSAIGMISWTIPSLLGEKWVQSFIVGE